MVYLHSLMMLFEVHHGMSTFSDDAFEVHHGISTFSDDAI